MIIVKRNGIYPEQIPDINFVHVHSDDNFFYFAENEDDIKTINLIIEQTQ